LHVYGREISVADIGFSNSLLKIKEDLELLLDIFNKSRICNGSISANEMTAYKTYFVLVNNMLKHVVNGSMKNA